MKTFREKYNELIEYRKNNPPKVGEYVEHHHIIPRSVNPDLTEDKDNIIALTGKEHFQAHCYLANAFKEEGDKDNARKMLYAIHLMKKQILKNSILNEDELNIVAEMYENARKELHKGENHPLFGKHHNEETRKKIGDKLRGIKRSDEYKKHLSEAWKGEKSYWYGKHRSEDTLKKISDSLRGNHWYNNGVCNKFCKECPGEGWTKGMLKIK